MLYQTAVPVAISTILFPCPYHWESVMLRQVVVSQIDIAFSVGCRAPLRRGRPRMPEARSGAGSYKAASSRKRVTIQSLWRAASSSSSAAKLLSATTTMGRSGTQRLTSNSNCWARSVSLSGRRPRFW
jgi:hypothetical protein